MSTWQMFTHIEASKKIKNEVQTLWPSTLPPHDLDLRFGHATIVEHTDENGSGPAKKQDGARSSSSPFFSSISVVLKYNPTEIDHLKKTQQMKNNGTM